MVGVGYGSVLREVDVCLGRDGMNHWRLVANLRSRTCDLVLCNSRKVNTKKRRSKVNNKKEREEYKNKDKKELLSENMIRQGKGIQLEIMR